SRICSSSLARHPRSTLLPYTTLFRSDAGGAAGDQHTFAADGALQTARQRKIRIEMALPVVPEPPSVVLQSRQTDARRLEQCARLHIVEERRQIQEAEHVAGYMQPRERLVEQQLQRLVVLQRRLH